MFSAGGFSFIRMTAIETTSEALVIVTETGSVRIPWEKCSARLSRASAVERSRVELSPSGYGIHWPLLDEDLAVGPLTRGATTESQTL
jgi:hypothetical protein